MLQGDNATSRQFCCLVLNYRPVYLFYLVCQRYLNVLYIIDLMIFYARAISRGGGPLVFEVGYHPRKKIHVIRVVFQDQAMYARTSFRGAKTCKIGKKGMFLVILTNSGMDMMLKLRKTHVKTRI